MVRSRVCTFLISAHNVCTAILLFQKVLGAWGLFQKSPTRSPLHAHFLHFGGSLGGTVDLVGIVIGRDGGFECVLDEY